MDNPKPPTAQEFRQEFFKALAECLPKTEEEQHKAYQNWTAFMTGKKGKNCWPEPTVLPLTATNLKLEFQPEELGFDLVFFPKGNPWGNFVAVEHENDCGVSEARFGREVVKLMSVLAPLKVGITYIWETQGENLVEDLERLIQNYFKTRHPQIQEVPETEYLFLLGIMRNNILRWKYLTFNCAATPLEFQDMPEQFHVYHRPRALSYGA